MDSEPAVNTKGATLVTRIGLAKPAAGLTEWLVKGMLLGSDFGGFISAEILPPDDGTASSWTIVQRFREKSQLDALKNSQQQKKFLSELNAAFKDDGLHLEHDEHTKYGQMATVTAAIVTHVKPGMEADYKSWESQVQLAQAKFPGYQGSYLQPAIGASSGLWVTLLRFDAPESLERWFASAERKALLESGEKFVDSFQVRKDVGSFPGWFPVDAQTGSGPPNWKTFLLVLLGLYPIVSLEIRFLMPALTQVPTAPANLIGNAISVALTTWVTMPLFINLFKGWLFPKSKESVADNLKWLALIAVLFGLELALMWNLLSPAK